MKKIILILCLACHLSVQAAEGMVTVKSAHSVALTADKLVAALQAKNMTIFNRIDHAEGGAGVGLTIRPTELVVFGNPKLGTRLMQCQQTTAIDLPMKALIYQDDNGQVFVSYNATTYLKGRHQIVGCDPVLAKATKALANFVRVATQ